LGTWNNLSSWRRNKINEKINNGKYGHKFGESKKILFAGR
jgi:hypothetical protein